MVILIGGVGYAGKTLMAQQLLEKYKYPYLSIDHLKMGLYRANIGCGFTPLDSVEYIGEKLWPVLKGIIMTNIENDQNIIIEGAYILPQKVNELEGKYQKKIISLYLGFSQGYIERYLKTGILHYRCAIESRDYENSKTLDEYLEENRKQKELCQNSNAKYFEIDTDYQDDISQAYAWIDNKLMKNKRRTV